VLNDIVKRKVLENQNAANSVENEPLVQYSATHTYRGRNANGVEGDYTVSKVFTINAPGCFVDIKGYDVTIEVLGDVTSIYGFAIHEQRQYTALWHDKYICIERFLISLGNVIAPDFPMYVPISDVLATYIREYGLKLGEDHSKNDNPQKIKRIDFPDEEKKNEEKKDKSVPGPQNAPAIGRSPPPAPVKLKPVVVANAAANAAANDDQSNKTDDEDYDKKPLLEKNKDS